MRKPIAVLCAALVVLAGATAARAASTLFEWGFNVGGTLYHMTSPPGTNASLFDFASGLGTISLTYSPGAAGSYQVIGYFDHEIDEASNTFFNEYGTAVGAPAAGQSWEIDEPGFVFGDIYGNLTAGTLDNSNGVPSASPDDVSLALGWNFLLAADQYALITFRVTDTVPGAGFYLRQSDPDSPYDLYLASSLDIRGGGQVVPEPSTLLLLAGGLAGLAAIARRRSRTR